MPAAAMVRQRLRERFRTEGPQVVRIVVAAALSWQICIWLGAQQPPVFAVVVPLVALRDHPYSVFNLSFDRMVGVIFGVLLAEGMVRLLGVSVLSVTIVLAVGLTLGVVLRIGAVLNVQVAVSAMLVFANPEPGAYGLTRIWETVIAAVVCVLVSPLLLPPNARKRFEAESSAVTAALSDQLSDLQRLLRDPVDRAALIEHDERAVRTDEAARALPPRWRPRSGRSGTIRCAGRTCRGCRRTRAGSGWPASSPGSNGCCSTRRSTSPIART